MQAISFSTKAGTLSRLHKRLRSASIAPSCVFTVAEWRADRRSCLGKVAKGLGPAPWIVRSSRQCEDGTAASHAGSTATAASVLCRNVEPMPGVSISTIP